MGGTNLGGGRQGANLRNVWVIPPEPCNWDFCLACGTFFAGQLRRAIKKHGTTRVCPCGSTDAWVDHYAAFPSELPRRCIMASTSERGVCPACGAPWARVVNMTGAYRAVLSKETAWNSALGKPQPDVKRHPLGHPSQVPEKYTTLGWRATCACNAGEPVPATVLDPFMGTGTTLLAVARLGRDAIGIDLSPRYVALAEARLAADAPLLGMPLAQPLAASGGEEGPEAI